MNFSHAKQQSKRTHLNGICRRNEMVFFSTMFSTLFTSHPFNRIQSYYTRIEFNRITLEMKIRWHILGGKSTFCKQILTGRKHNRTLCCQLPSLSSCDYTLLFAARRAIVTVLCTLMRMLSH